MSPTVPRKRREVREVREVPDGLDPVAHPSGVLRDPLLPAESILADAGVRGQQRAEAAVRDALQMLNVGAGRARVNAEKHAAYVTRADAEGDARLAALHDELVRVHEGYAAVLIETGRRLRGLL